VSPLRMTLVEFSPSGGLFQFTHQLAGGLAADGHQVELITGHHPELVAARPGLRVLSILPTWHPQSSAVEATWLRKPRRVWRAVLYLEAWRRTWRHLLKTQPDVVQFSEWRFALDGLAVILLAHRLPRTVLGVVAHTPRPLVEQRSTGDMHKAGPLLHRALAAAYARMDVVFVLGKRSRADLLAAYPRVRRVQVVAHGDAGALIQGNVSAASGTPPRVLMFGTLARYKGAELLLDAWARVRSIDEAAELVIAGAPIDVDVAALRARATEVGGVELRLGYVPTGQVGEMISGARVVVAPYLIANQSGVVHLAHTAARPVVATDVGDLSAVVLDGETGLLVPKNDPVALADALLMLLRDPAAAERMGRAGQERLAEGASWEKVASSLATTYNELASAAAQQDKRPARDALRSEA